MTISTELYQVTLVIELERNPRKWIADKINDALEAHENLINYSIKHIGHAKGPQ